MTTTPHSAAIETIRQRWLFLHCGAGAPPTVRASVAPAIEKLDAAADRTMARQTWDPASPEHGNLYGKPLRTPAELATGRYALGMAHHLAMVWRCPFSRHSQQPAVLERLVAGLRFTERFVRPDQPRDGAWHGWDISCPLNLCCVLLLCGDQLPADLRRLVLEDLEHLPSKVFTLERLHGITRPPVSSGDNNLTVLYSGLLRGLILNDPQWLDTVLAQVPIVMGRTTGSEGLQNDWSYQFHGHGVNVGYGVGSMITQGHWLYLTQGTPWQVPDAVRELHVGMVREFFARNWWRGKVAPYSTDRGIVSPHSLSAVGYLSGILYGLAVDLPPSDQAVFAAAAADCFRSLDPDGKPVPQSAFIQHRSGLVNALLLAGIPQPIRGDLSILGGMRYFPMSEYLLVREPDWFAAVRMSSDRTSTWKSQLGANTVGSSTAEFSIALMTDGREFDNTTIPTMNWKRLMGVTRCDAIEPPPEGYGQSAFCGGLAGDDLAVLGLQYLLAPAGQDALRANKSVFVTPTALVLLGTQIHCDSATPVVTTLFHVPLITDAPAPSCHSERSEETRSSRSTGVYLRNGSPLDISQDGVWEIKAGETLYLRNVGIRLLTDAQLIVETRKGNYAEKNMAETFSSDAREQRGAWFEAHERRWVYLVVNHGVQPTNGRYGAILYPMAAPDQLPAADQFQIVHQDELHRVSLKARLHPAPEGAPKAFGAPPSRALVVQATTERRPPDLGSEVRFPGDWRRKLGLSYWGAEQHQWGNLARWTPSGDPDHANLEITVPRRFAASNTSATEIFLPDGLEQENVTLKTYEGRLFPANLISTDADGSTLKLRVRRTGTK